MFDSRALHERVCAGAARHSRVDPDVVAAFLKNAACRNLSASVTLPQEKGLQTFRHSVVVVKSDACFPIAEFCT